MPIISVPITSDEQWHGLRAQNVGCSEIGALFGVHEHLTGFGLAARKLGKLPELSDSAVLKRGRLLEPVARQLLAEDRQDWHQVAAGNYYYDPDVHFGATPDLFVRDLEDRLGVVQIKTVAPQTFAKNWHNDDGAIVPPLWIALQAMGEQYLAGADFAVIAALVVGYGLSLEVIEVPMLPSVIDQARQKLVAFWELVARGDLPPPDYGVDGEVLRQVLRDDDGSEIDLSYENELPEQVAALERLKMVRKTTQEAIDKYQAQILHRIGSAQRARFAGGVITAKTITIREHFLLDRERANEMPEIMAQLEASQIAKRIPASSYRRLNVKLNHRNEERAPA